jgi:hypothetical protein
LDTTITFEELEKTPSKRWFKCGCKYMFDSLKSDPKLVFKNEGKLLKTKQYVIPILPSSVPLMVDYFPNVLILSHR